MNNRIVLYRKQRYEVIAETLSLLHIRPEGEQDDWHSFWVVRGATITPEPKEEKQHKLYRGIDLPDYVVAWCMEHITRITANIPEKDEARFGFNLKAANGQEYTRLLPGVTLAGEGVEGIAMLCTFDVSVPEIFNDDITKAQYRWGCHQGNERVEENPREVFCNALAWELLRHGKQLG